MQIGHYVMTMAHQLSPYATSNYAGEALMRVSLLRSPPAALQAEFDEREQSVAG